MLLAFHCTGACPVKFFEKDSTADLTGAFPYSTGELEANIPSGLNFYPVKPLCLFCLTGA